jgi:FAD/FMN-containing dehydrogenase
VETFSARKTSGYDDARRLWNGMINRRPLLIVRCLGLTDVVETIRFSRDHDIPMTVRGGGHGVFGESRVGRGSIAGSLLHENMCRSTPFANGR